MAGKKVRVLIVDDDDAMRATLRELLESGGHEICGEAGDGLQAIAVAERERPDLVTMDVAMPRMGGIEATRTILSARPALRVVMVSSLDEAALVHAATAAGAAAFLRKPPRAAPLLAAVDRALAPAA